MKGTSHTGKRRWGWLCCLSALLLGASGLMGTATAQDNGSTPQVKFATETVPARLSPVPAGTPIVDDQVMQASGGCSSCGGGGGVVGGGAYVGGVGGYGGYHDHWKNNQCMSCGEGCAPCGHCVPGRDPCCPDSDSILGHLWGGVYHCVCCPDPCYVPRWKAGANSAFFTDQVRPKTQTMFRWDHGIDGVFLDRGEFFAPRSDGNGKGLRPKGGFLGISRFRYNELYMYTEAATDKVGAYVAQPYREVEPLDFSGDRGTGFGDLKIGVKTLFLDCELMQISFLMETSVPTGSPSDAAGTGHVSINPSLLFAIKLAPYTYWQSQVGEYFAVGGDKDFSGSVLRYSTSVNHVFPVLCGLDLVWTGEFFGYTFQGGRYTDPVLGIQDANGDPLLRQGNSYLSVGSGVRLVICDKVDFGYALAKSITDDNLADWMSRFEFRWRF